MKIFIEGPYTTQNEIDSCIKAFNEIRDGHTDGILHLEAKSEIKELDVQLIAYFMLFKDLLPDLIIYLSLPFNTKPSDSVAWKVRTYGTHAYIMTGSQVFRLIIAGTTILFDFNMANTFPANFYTLSGNFMLLVFVKKERIELFDLLFETRKMNPAFQNQHILANGVDWEIHNDLLFKNVRDQIIVSADPRDPLSCVANLGKIAFYQIIYQAKVLSIYLDPERIDQKDYQRTNLEADTLIPKYEKDTTKLINHPYLYYDQIKQVITEMETSSVIELLIMSTLMSSRLFPGIGKSAIDNPAVEILQRLWGFTKELAYGLKELAKNIREHSSTHSGVLTGKIYSEHSFWRLLSNDAQSQALYERYMQELAQKYVKPVKSFLDLHIVDIGDGGVIPQLLSSSVEAAKKCIDGSKLEELFLEDVELLKMKKIGFREILNPTKTNFLHQQSKRSIAHFGLLIFNKLIVKSKGLLMASSLGINGKREYIISPVKNLAVPYMAPIGTNYHIILPVHPEVEFEPQLPQHDILPPETSALDIQGLERLFGFTQIREDNLGPLGSTVDIKGKYLVTIVVPNQKVIDRVQESKLWELLAEKVLAIERRFGNKDNIFNLDFDGTQFDGSILLRLMATWNTEFPKKSLVITNISNSLFKGILSLNEDFIEHNKILNDNPQDLIFWNAKAAIIIYHYIIVRGDRFYFADSIFGKDHAEHFRLNKLISRTNFNFTQLLNEAPPNTSQQLVEKLRPYNGAFYNGNVLLPFDIILTGGNASTSLFEQNSTVLLKNVIKPKTTA